MFYQEKSGNPGSGNIYVSNFSTGKLQIRASGRAQLIVGDMAMDIDFGTQESIL
jgi:hypothetical protein